MISPTLKRMVHRRSKGRGRRTLRLPSLLNSWIKEEADRYSISENEVIANLIAESLHARRSRLRQEQLHRGT